MVENNENNSFTNKEEPKIDPARVNNPYAQGFPLHSKSEKNDAAFKASGAESRASGIGSGVSDAQSQVVQNETVAKVPEKTKRLHIHTIICVSFIVFTIGCFFSAFFFSSLIKRSAAKNVKELSFSETMVGERFLYYENNMVHLDNRAFTVFNAGESRSFPEGEKLIGIYVQVESEEWLEDSEAFSDFYIGYDRAGRKEYRTAAYPYDLLPYLERYGFDEDKALSAYGCGNGWDEEGWFFFFVPEEITEMTLYMEKREMKGSVSYLRELYLHEYTVLEKDIDRLMAMPEWEVG